MPLWQFARSFVNAREASRWGHTTKPAAFRPCENCQPGCRPPTLDALGACSSPIKQPTAHRGNHDWVIAASTIRPQQLRCASAQAAAETVRQPECGDRQPAAAGSRRLGAPPAAAAAAAPLPPSAGAAMRQQRSSSSWGRPARRAAPAAAGKEAGAGVGMAAVVAPGSRPGCRRSRRCRRRGAAGHALDTEQGGGAAGP